MGQFWAYSTQHKRIDTKLSGGNLEYYQTIAARALEIALSTAPGEIGTVSCTKHEQDSILQRLAAEEAKYCFLWRSGRPPRGEITPAEGEPRFVRLDVERSRRLDQRTLETQLKSQPDHACPVKREDPGKKKKLIGNVRATLSLEPVDKDHVTIVLQDGPALYQDVNDPTCGNKLEEAGGKLIPVDVWVPRQAYDLPNAIGECECYEELDGSCGTQRRYAAYLFDQMQQFPSFAGQSTYEANYKDKFHKKKTEDVVRQLETTLSRLKLPKARADSIRQSARDCVKDIPIGHYCLYFADGEGALRAFLTDISLEPEGSARGSYAMRIDPPGEMPFDWSIARSLPPEEKAWAEAIAQLIGLPSDPMRQDLTFEPTNVPRVRLSTRVRFAPLLTYSKHFPSEPSVRLLDPQNPKPPRLPGVGKNDKGPPLASAQLNAQLLKWKKGDRLQGEARGTGERDTREDAGTIMGMALRSIASAGSDDDISAFFFRSKLPANAFARFVIGLNDDTKQDWKSHTDRDDLVTAQEWCHLYGHGDGGRETLDNFVSGSKHCNTEQLAIELGQRRVSQNKELKELWGDLTWRVTAHLVRNPGIRKVVPGSKKSTIGRQDLEKAWSANIKPKGPEWPRSWTDARGNLTPADKPLADTLEDIAADIKQRLRDAKAPGVQDQDKTTAQNAAASLMELYRWVQDTYGIVYPLAKWIHYRIFVKHIKCFEHYIDAQSESFDLNEAHILENTVERSIYRGLDAAYPQKRLTVGDKSLSLWEYYVHKRFEDAGIPKALIDGMLGIESTKRAREDAGNSDEEDEEIVDDGDGEESSEGEEGGPGGEPQPAKKILLRRAKVQRRQ